MTAGKPATTYTVTLCRQDKNGLPVMTPYTVGKHTYEKVAEVLYKAQRGKRQR